MKSFCDVNGKKWNISITVGSIKRVRDLAGVDLLDMKNGAVFEKLSSDPIALCDCLWALCSDQAEKDGVTETEFFDAMAGDAIDSATVAMLDDLVAFFPNAKRALLENLLRKLRTVQTLAINHAGELLDQVNMEAIAQASGKSSTNSQDASESTQTA